MFKMIRSVKPLNCGASTLACQVERCFPQVKFDMADLGPTLKNVTEQ